MLRETKAKLLTAFTAALVLGLAALFSLFSNPPPSKAQAPAAVSVSSDPRLEAGRRAFDRLGCARCHSIAGKGDTGSPLDDVGSRLDSAMLEAWTVGGEAAVRGGLPASLAKRKAGYAADPDLGALIAYLQSLRSAKPQGAPVPAGK